MIACRTDLLMKLFSPLFQNTMRRRFRASAPPPLHVLFINATQLFCVLTPDIFTLDDNCHLIDKQGRTKKNIYRFASSETWNNSDAILGKTSIRTWSFGTAKNCLSKRSTIKSTLRKVRSVLRFGFSRPHIRCHLATLFFERSLRIFYKWPNLLKDFDQLKSDTVPIDRLLTNNLTSLQSEISSQQINFPIKSSIVCTDFCWHWNFVSKKASITFCFCSEELSF